MSTMRNYKVVEIGILSPYGGRWCIEKVTLHGRDMMKNKTLEEIGKRLVSARKAKGYTQEQLSNVSNLSIKMISAAENGHKAMRPENIIKLCESLSISTDYLLFGESAKLRSLAEYDEIKQLTPKQKEALSKIIEDFLSAFE